MPRFLLALSLLGIIVSLTCAQEAGSGGSSSNVTQLHIAYIVSFGGEYDSSGSLVAVEMARERINQHPGGLLEGYELVIETPQRNGTGDSQVRSYFRYTCSVQKGACTCTYLLSVVQ